LVGSRHWHGVWQTNMVKKSDMVRKHASIEQVRFCRDYLEKGSIGNRGDFDGDELHQLFGLMAQVVISDSLNELRPINTGEFDGGYDIEINGKKYDVKCEIRNVNFRVGEFVHNLVGAQLNYEAEGFIFVSYNKQDGVFEICGYINKEDFKKRSKFYPKGTLRERTNGTQMQVKPESGLYEIRNRYLKPFVDLLEGT